jgi:methyl-accepting chemotaxis protein
MASDTTIRISAIDQTREAFQSVQRNIGGMQNSLKGMAGPLAAAFSVAAIGTFAKSIIDTADALGDLSERTGITVEELSRLGNAAELNGSSTTEFNDAIQKFQKSLAEAQKGTGSQSDAFKTLGISIRDANGNFKDTTSLFYEVADAMAGTAEGATKTKVAQDLLGRSGSNLIPVLNQGAEALKTYQATFDDDFVQRAGEFNDNLTKLGNNLESLAVTLLGPVVSGFNQFFEFLERGANREAIAGTFDMFTGELPQHMENTAKAANNVATAIPKVTRTLVDSAKAMQEQAKEIERLTALSKDYADLTDRIAQQQATAQKGAEERNRNAMRLLEEIRTPTQRYAEELSRVNILYDEGRFSAEEYSLILEKLRENFIGVQEGVSLAGISIDDIGRNAMMNLEDSIIDLINGTTSLQDSFKKMATSIINDLLRMYIRYMIVKPLFDALFGAPSGPAAPIVQSSPGVPTGRAIGGPVSAGKPFVVGERGAELFVPNSSGSIVPNHKMGGETNNIVVNVNMENGSVNATDANRLGVLVGNVVKAELVKQSRPGGLLAA